MNKVKLRITNYKLRIFVYIIIISVIYLSFIIYHSSFARAMSQAVSDAQSRGVYLGIFREGAPRNMSYIYKFEEQTGKKPAMIMWFQDWTKAFPVEEAQRVVDYGAVPHIAWEARYWGDDGKVKLKDIIAGRWDGYIRSWASALRTFGRTVFLRIGHEFNVEVYPWGIVNNGKKPETFVKAYRHIVDVFRKEGADSVKWIWCFNNYSNPNEPWNDWAMAYPGDDYVDWIGIDGYNWGTTQAWSGWEDFKGLFRNQLRRARKLWPDKPIMIAEFGSTEDGGNKAAWIGEIPGYLKTSMRDIDAVIWFDIRKETDWRISSSKSSLKAFQQIMKDPLFLSSGEGLASLAISLSKTGGREKKQAFALRAPGPVEIDGKLAEWDKSGPITMKDKSYFKEGLTWGGPKDLSGTAYLMWDENYLYLAAVINDKIPLVNTKTQQDIWNGDAIELVLGLNSKADPNRAVFSGGDYQIGFGTGNGKNIMPSIWNWQRRRVPAGSQIAVKKKAEPLGHILEAKIPWDFFRSEFVPESGAKIGFDLAFDDADGSGERERQFIWNGDFYFYNDPSVWGVLQFD